MLKKKELSKKKNLLMLLWDECIAFKVLFFILARPFQVLCKR